jgi:hypothetical protein
MGGEQLLFEGKMFDRARESEFIAVTVMESLSSSLHLSARHISGRAMAAQAAGHGC